MNTHSVCAVKERTLKSFPNEFVFMCANKSQRHAHLIAEKIQIVQFARVPGAKPIEIYIQHTIKKILISNKKIFSHPLFKMKK